MTTPAAPPRPLLRAIELTVDFGPVRAVDGVSLDVAEGELVGLIGPNGAGKTTTIDALSGFVPHRGRVVLDGVDLSDLPPHARARHGLVRTFQSLELFDDLTVRENCIVAAHPGGVRELLTDLVRPSRARDTAQVDWALDLLGLGPWAGEHPSSLPLGVRKLVAVARSLSSAGTAGATAPRVVLLDEPAAGLDSAESLALGERLREVVAAGVSVLLVDHDMGLVLSVCDRLVVLDFGATIAQGTPGAVRDDPRVIAAYLGEHAVAAGGAVGGAAGAGGAGT